MQISVPVLTQARHRVTATIATVTHIITQLPKSTALEYFHFRD